MKHYRNGPSVWDLAIAYGVRWYEDTRWALKRALYRTGAAGCPECGRRQGHKMDCREDR